MNCNRFRFLIQQSFDMELSPQDEQMATAHLDSCQSCEKFQHQIDQVVQAATELQPPDDAVPGNLESLARLIMQQLPQQKGGVFNIFGNIFGGGGGGGGAKTSQPKQKAKKEAPPPAEKGSRFPHVKRQQPTAEQAQAPAPPAARGGGNKKTDKIEMDDQRATAARLKGLSKRNTGQIESVEQQSQSTTGARSLGEKFGMSMPGQGGAVEEQPMTLADSIRRKMQEERQQKGDEPGWDSAPPQEQALAQPPGAPAPAQDDWGSQPDPGWGAQPAGAPPAPAQPAGGPGGWGQGAQGPQGAQGWGQNAPAGGAWEEAATPQGGGWEEPATPQGGGWDEPGGAPAAAQGGGWGAAPAQDAAWGQSQSGSDWGAQQPAAEAGWGGAPATPAGDWGQPEAPAPAPATAPATDWGQPAGASAPQQPAAADNAWGAPQGQPQPPAQGGWGQSQPQTTDDWGQPAAATGNIWDKPGGGDSGWSSEAEQIQTGMWQAFTPDGLGSGAAAAPAASAVPPAPPAPAAPPAPPTADRWDVPIQERMQQQAAAPQPEAAAAAAPAADRWDLPIQERMKMQQQAPGAAPPPAPAPAPAPATSASGLPVDSIMDRLTGILGDSQPPAAPAAAPAADRWDVPIQERGQQPPPPVPPAADRFDVPIQERQQQPSAPAPAPPAADRFDIPIQERLQQQQAAQPQQQAAGQPQAAAQPEADRWDMPIQERMKMQQQGAAPAATPAQADGLFNLDDSAIDKLFGDNLGVTEPAKPVGGPTIQPVTARGGASPPPPPAPPPAPPAPPAAAPTISPVTARQTGAQPVQPPAPPPPAPPQPAAAQAQGSGIFNLDDSAIDKLFGDNLGVTEPVKPVSAQPAPPPAPPPAPQPAAAQVQGGWTQAQAAPPPPPAPPQPAAAQAAQGGGLFAFDDDAMDKLFGDNLGVQDAQAAAAKVNVTQAVESIRSASGVQGQAPVKVEGMGKLASADTAQDVGSGKIAQIGKFLLDQQDLTKIGKLAGSDLSDTKMRILTLEAAQELQGLLQTIGQQQGVLGSVIVGHDGILIANNMPQSIDPESVGVWALGVYLNTDNVVKKMGHNHVHQVVCRTPPGYLVIADFGGGILVTVTEGSDTDKLMPLMRSITQLVAQ